jgi:hypothetical protein
MDLECLGDEVSIDNCSCSKCRYIEGSLSREYIIMRLKIGESKERAILRGMEEHIESLMTELYHEVNIRDKEIASLKNTIAE